MADIEYPVIRGAANARQTRNPDEGNEEKNGDYIPRVRTIANGRIATIANEVSTSVDAASVSQAL